MTEGLDLVVLGVVIAATLFGFVLAYLLLSRRVGLAGPTQTDLHQLERLEGEIRRIEEKISGFAEKQLERGQKQSAEVRQEVEKKLADFRNQIDQTISRFQKSIGESDEKSRKLIEQLRQSLLEQVGEVSKQVTEKLSGTGEMIQQLSKQLGALAEAQGELERLSRSLESALGSPKAIGEFGEKMLENILRDILPADMFSLQHEIGGNRVDAAVKVGDDRWLPIDSKFPLQNLRRYWEAQDEREKNRALKEFVRDFQKRVEEISSKYIREDQGTLDLAMMFIPSEKVYFQILSPELSDRTVGYAKEHKVIPVSPNSLYAYLSAALVALQGKRIERQAKMVLVSLNRLSQLLDEVEKSIQTSDRQTGWAKSNIEEAMRKLGRLRAELDSLYRLRGASDEELEALPAGEAAALEAGELDDVQGV